MVLSKTLRCLGEENAHSPKHPSCETWGWIKCMQTGLHEEGVLF